MARTVGEDVEQVVRRDEVEARERAALALLEVRERLLAHLELRLLRLKGLEEAGLVARGDTVAHLLEAAKELLRSAWQSGGVAVQHRCTSQGARAEVAEQDSRAMVSTNST